MTMSMTGDGFPVDLHIRDSVSTSSLVSRWLSSKGNIKEFPLKGVAACTLARGVTGVQSKVGEAKLEQFPP